MRLEEPLPLVGCTEFYSVLVMLTRMYVCVLVVQSFILFEIKESIGLRQVHLRISQKGMSLV